MTTKRKAQDGQLELSTHLDKLIDAAVDIRQNPDDVERSYMARQLVQCTLPHSDPGGDEPIWTRKNGDLTLTVRPNFDTKTKKALYPYGSIPRLLLFWLCAEAVQKKSPTIKLGKSLDGFMREIGLNPRTGGGKRGDAARLHSQMERLFGSVISFEDSREGKRFVNMQVAARGHLWWEPGQSRQDNLWESWVQLGEDFFKAITAAPVPVDVRALKMLKRSPLALDLYSWLTYTTFVVSRNRKSRLVPWNGLFGQLGSELSTLKNFKAKVTVTLRKVKLAYPALRVEVTSEGLVIHPAPLAIPTKKATSLR